MDKNAPFIFSTKLLAGAIATVLVPFAGMAFTQELALEEIIVTAQKRAQGLQDVPIAVAVMDGTKIEQQGIASLVDLALYMPAVHIAEAGTGTNLFIRGIGSGINYGFEQSVGTFIDGVYYGRDRNARNAFLDVARVEILKGPQSTLFGKNTIAGAINITSQAPTDEFNGYIEGKYIDEYRGWGSTVLVNGALSDSVNARLVANVYQDHGYVENTYTSDDGPQKDNAAVRLSLAWQASDNLRLLFKGEYSTSDVLGRPDMISIAGDQALANYRALSDPNFSADLDYKKSSADFPGRPQRDDTTADIAQLTLDYQWGEFELRAISAYNQYEFDQNLDVDYGPLVMLERARQEEHSQFSQEFLLSSPTGGFIDYLAGVYYQRNELDSDRQTPVAISAVPSLEAALLPLSSALVAANQARFGFTPENPFVPYTTGGIDTTGVATFHQQTETVSAFGSFTFNWLDNLRTTVGLRYSHETKEVDKFQGSFNTTPDAKALQFVYDVVLALSTPHEYSLERSEDHWTGNINLQWDASDEIMVYANIANGFKGGGFDEDNARANLATAEFEDETVVSYEVGAKMGLLDGRARLNVAAFRSEFDDVQVSTFDGNCCFAVGNAASTISQGVELDGSIVLTRNWRLSAALTYLDAYYDDYTDAACNVWQITAGQCPDDVQDLSGKPLQFAPEWSANVSLGYRRMLGDTLALTASTDINWQTDTIVAADHDPALLLEEHAKVNARLQLGAENGRWWVALLGKNLTDETTHVWGNDVPLGAFGFNFTYFQIVDPPRTLELQARYSF